MSVKTVSFPILIFRFGTGLPAVFNTLPFTSVPGDMLSSEQPWKIKIEMINRIAIVSNDVRLYF